MWPAGEEGSAAPGDVPFGAALGRSGALDSTPPESSNDNFIDELPVTKWLADAGLERYKEKFAAYGVRSYLDLVRRADERLLKFMKVHKVHIKKLKRLVADLNATLSAACVILTERNKKAPNADIVKTLQSRKYNEESIGAAWDLVGNHAEVLPTPEAYNAPVVSVGTEVTFKHPHRLEGRAATVKAFSRFTSAGIRVWELSLENGYTQVAGENRLQVATAKPTSDGPSLPTRQNSDTFTPFRDLSSQLPSLPGNGADPDDDSDSSMDGFNPEDRIETIVPFKSGRPVGSRGTVVAVPGFGKIRVRWDDGKVQTIGSLTKIEKVKDESRPSNVGVPIPMLPAAIDAALPPDSPAVSRQNSALSDKSGESPIRRGISFRERIASFKDMGRSGDSRYDADGSGTSILKTGMSPSLPRVTSYSVMNAGTIDANGIYKPIFDQNDESLERCRWVKYTSHFTYHIYLIEDEDAGSAAPTSTWWLVKCPYEDEYNETDLYFADATGSEGAPPSSGWQTQNGGGKHPAPSLKRLRSSIMVGIRSPSQGRE